MSQTVALTHKDKPNTDQVRQMKMCKNPIKILASLIAISSGANQLALI